MKKILLVGLLICSGLSAIGLVSCGTTKVSSSREEVNSNNPVTATKRPSPTPVAIATNPPQVISTPSPALTTVTTAPTTIINAQGQIEWVGNPPQGLTAKDCSDSSAPMSQKQSNSQICRSLIDSNTAVDSGFHDRMVDMTARAIKTDGDYYKRMSEVDREAAAARRELANQNNY